MRTDPATLEIMHSYFNSIVNGMGHVIERTSFTTFVKESADFATALATPTGDFFAYPKSVGVTIFLGLNIKKAVDEVGELKPGDIIITNDPYSTDGLASHLPDVHVIKPIFYQGEIISYAWTFVHCSDVGGLVPTSISPRATDVHQEGLRVPPVKLYREGELCHDIRKIFDSNSRIPDLNYGDVNAMVAAVNTAESRMDVMIEKFGVDAIRSAMLDLIDQSELRSSKVIKNIPDGQYSFSDYLDDDMLSEVPIRLAVDITVNDGEILVDFSRCDPQVQSAFNLVTNGSKHPFMLQGLVNYIISEDPFIPINGGIVYPIKVHAPKGSVVNPEYPAAVGVRHSITMRLYSTVLGALSQAIPETVPAAGGGQAAIVALSTLDTTTGTRDVAVVQPLGGGGGGQSDMDGVDGIDHASGFLKNTPIESLEQHIDILVHRYEYIPDTAGPGFHRGGHAIRLDFEVIQPNSSVTARGMERMRFQPWGLRGGHAGMEGSVTMNPDTGRAELIPKINVLTPEEGDVVSINSPSGGGWGQAVERSPELVLKEVADELLSIENAKKQYGVIIQNKNNSLQIDYQQTERYRDKMELHAYQMVDYGKARREYEAVWTPEASDTLVALLQQKPATQRWYLKQRIHQKMKERATNDAITKEMIFDIWNELNLNEESLT